MNVANSRLQKPDDFNFDVTRAINSPHHLKDMVEPTSDAKPHSDDSDSKNEKEPVETVRPVEEGHVRAGITDEKDLDPVALNKAFKFAAWSSVVLVRILSLL
jgi:hypothetical protein